MLINKPNNKNLQTSNILEKKSQDTMNMLSKRSAPIY